MGGKAPLFPGAVVFGLGCGVGLWSRVAWPVWLTLGAGLLVAAGLFWWRSARSGEETPAQSALRSGFVLALVLLLGAFLGALRVQWVAADDLRHLGPAKRDPGTEWRGVIVSNPVTRESGRTDFFFQVEAWRPLTLDTLLVEQAPWRPASGEVFVEINPTRRAFGDTAATAALAEARRFRYGQKLEMTGGLDFPRGALNPGQFDWREYLKKRDVFYKLRANRDAIEIVSEAAGYPWTRAAAWAQEWTLQRLRLGMEDDAVVSQLIGGMLLGYTQKIPDELKTAFYNTETYHIFAVSGQNVGVLLVLGLLVLRFTGLTWWRWAWLVAPLLVFYVLVTGNQPSAIRALCMALLLMLAWRWERPVSVLNLWSMAVLLVLAVDPQLLLDLGFQLSFAVVLALILISPPVYRCLMGPWRLDPFLPRQLVTPAQWRTEKACQYLVGLLAGSIAAWLGALPFMLVVFHRLSPIGLVANLWVVPLASLVVVIGTLAVALSLIAPPLAVAVNNANWAVVKLMVGGVVWLNGLPGAYFYLPDPGVELRPERPVLVCAAAGNATVGLLRHGDRAWLINTGNDFGWHGVVNPLRQFYGVNAFDGVFLTEPGTSVNGMVGAVADERLTRRWWLVESRPTPRFARAWRQIEQSEQSEQGEPPPVVFPLRGGEEIDLGEGLRVSVLWPPGANEPSVEPSRVADRSAVLLIEYEGRRVLWATRIGFGVELALLRAHPGLRAEVLVQGAHGSEMNRSGPWLLALQPQAVVMAAPPRRWRSRRQLDLSVFPPSERPALYQQEDSGAVTLRWTEAGLTAEPFIPPPGSPAPQRD